MKPTRFLFLLIMILLLTSCDSSFSEEDISRVYHQWAAAFKANEGTLPENIPGQTRVPVVEAINNQMTTPVVPTLIIPVSTACNLAVSGMPIDVTIPDGTRLRSGQSFSKTWRLVNAGSCTWGQGYSTIWFSGEILSQSRIQFLRGVVLPGQSIDITVEMTAPKNAGVYQSNWKLSDPNANLFGIGPNGEAPFWVLIEVIEEISSPTAAATTTPIPELAIYSQGILLFAMEDMIDLDNGNLNTGDQDDLSFSLNDKDVSQLIVVGNARMVKYGTGEPTHLDCQNLEHSEVPIELEGLTIDDYICYRTGQALPGFFRIIQNNQEENTFDLEYTTWAIP